MRRPRTEARPGDWMMQKGLTNQGPLQKPDFSNHFGVFRNAFAIQVHEAKIVLRHRKVLLGGALVPFCSLREVLRNALAVFIHEAEKCLRARVALLSERAE